MNNFYKPLFYAILLLLASCEKDPLASFDCDIKENGFLCRTYLFEYDENIGFVDYAYEDSLLKRTSYKNNRGKKQKEITYTYNSKGSILSELTNYSSGSVEKTVYGYTVFDKMSEVQYFENEERICNVLYYYNADNKLKKREVFSLDVLDSIVLYEYDNGGDLWRVSYYNEATNLLYYHIWLFYDNNIVRINKFDNNDVLFGYELFLFNDDLNIVNSYKYNDKNEVLDKFDYIYDNKKLIQKSRYNGFEQRLSYEVLFYS